MALCRSPFSLALLGTALLLSIGSLSFVTSFTVTPSLPLRTRVRASPISEKAPPLRQLHPITHSSSSPRARNDNARRSRKTKITSLQMNSRNDDTYGFKEGRYLLILAAIFNIWMFSIPPEFRRARFCSEEQVANYPDSHCTTFGTWREGIADYYANGGGVEFDFSVEGKE